MLLGQQKHGQYSQEVHEGACAENFLSPEAILQSWNDWRAQELPNKPQHHKEADLELR